MVRDYRIKEVILAGATPTSGTAGLYSPVYSNDINGEILKITWKSNVKTGSTFLNVSGINEVIWSSLTTSGAGWQTIYPFVYSSDSISTTGSPQSFTSRVVNGLPVYWCGSGYGGGSIVNIIVNYR